MRSFFVPLRGMVQIWNEWFRDQNLFSPPCGDGTSTRRQLPVPIRFSPPYGDGTILQGTVSGVYKFSPPYGDGTDAEDKANAEEMFSPPYGDSTSVLQYGSTILVFSPPYGENPLSHGLRRASSPQRGSFCSCRYPVLSSPFRGSWRAAPERVLRGEVEVWYKDFDGMAKKVLSPYGDGTQRSCNYARSKVVFVPLRGWYKMMQAFFNMIAVFAPLRGWYRA